MPDKTPKGTVLNSEDEIIKALNEASASVNENKEEEAEKIDEIITIEDIVELEEQHTPGDVIVTSGEETTILRAVIPAKSDSMSVIARKSVFIFSVLVTIASVILIIVNPTLGKTPPKIDVLPPDIPPTYEKVGVLTFPAETTPPVTTTEEVTEETTEPEETEPPVEETVPPTTTARPNNTAPATTAAAVSYSGAPANLSAEEITAWVNQQVPGVIPQYITPYYQNTDLVGHIRIPNLNLPETSADKYAFNYFVYQTVNNDFYIDHNENRVKSVYGAIFADFRTIVPVKTATWPDNTLVFGHNIVGGRYFAKLSRYHQITDMSFYRNHPIVSFDSITGRTDWKIFACVLFNVNEKDGEVFDYINKLTFTDKNDFNNYILNIMDRSVIFTDVDLTYGDRLLTLSTCYYPFDAAVGRHVETRVVVFARKVRDGESNYVDTSKAVYNKNYYPFALQAQVEGNNWIGRVWNTNYLLSLNA